MSRLTPKEALKTVTVDTILAAILCVLAGIALIVMPHDSGVMLCLFIGLFLVALSIVAIVGALVYGGLFSGYSLVTGIAFLLCGILCIAEPDITMGVITILLGIIIVVDASSTLACGVECARFRLPGSAAIVISSALLVVLGFAVMFSPAEMTITLLGWLLIFDGIFDLAIAIMFGKTIREAKRRMHESDFIDLGEM